MGKRGPKPKHHLPEGTITRKGYHRIFRGGRLVMAHRWVWEQRHGPIPDGMQVHHANGDKLDNRIENLELLSPLEHKREHSGCEFRDGEWWKRCTKCGESKHLNSEFYWRRGHPHSRCKPCVIRQSVECKQRRRLREVREAQQVADTA